MNPALRQTQAQTGTAAKLAAILAVLFVVATLVPQTNYYGRGARTTYTLFALWCIAAFLAGGLWSTVVRQQTYFLLALPYMGALVVTYFWRADVPGPMARAIIDLVQLLMGFALASYHAQENPARWVRMREWMIFLIALALLPSLELLYGNSGIARDLQDGGQMEGMRVLDTDILRLGVGTYFTYTPLSVVLPCWLSLALVAAGGRRLLLLASVVVTSLAVVLSSYTAATVQLVAGVAVVLVRLPFSQRYRLNWLLLLVAGGAVAGMVVGGKILFRNSSSFEFSTEKAVRLFTGIAGSGLVAGDETGRGELFVMTAKTFSRNPVFGVGYDFDGSVTGGHSSWVDPWAQFGVVGYLTFFLFQVLLTRRVLRNWRRQPRNIVAFGSMVCWVVFWASGALNPVIMFVLPAVLLFTDCYLDNASARPPRVARGRMRRTVESAPEAGVTKLPTTVR